MPAALVARADTIRALATLFLLTAVPAMAYLITPALSPVVHEDGRVTLAFEAPQADSVKVSGNLSDEPVPMRVDSAGVWRVTLGPLEPGVYFYTFEVDGLSILDPTNPWVHKGLEGGTSVFLVSDTPPAAYEERDVPRGTAHLHRHRSRLLGDDRGYEVYTPPGYAAEPERRYPVLYLLHGYTDTETAWRLSGRSDVILDNLIASGEAEPMIVVRPFGYAPPQAGDVQEGAQARQVWGHWLARVTPRFAAYLLEELMPRVEAEYRTLADARHRGIVGLSMGGGQALFIGLGHADTFAWIGAFSASVLEPVHGPLLADPEALNRQLSLLWIGCGRDDFLYEANTAFLTRLDSLGIEHTARISDGGHSWPVWQGYLEELLPLLFTGG